MLSLKSLGKSCLYTKFAILEKKLSFCLWWLWSVLKFCKAPKYYEGDCLNCFVILFCFVLFFLLSTLYMVMTISGKSSHLAQKYCFYQKRASKQNWENPGQNIWNKWSNPVILGRKRKVWYLLLRVFYLLFASCKFPMWDLALGYVSIQIWCFSNVS